MNRITDYFLVRVAGLPFSALNAIEFSETLAHIRTVESLEEDLLRRRQTLCDELHEFTRTQVEPNTRIALIELKRCIFNLRLPPEPSSPTALAGILSRDQSLQQRVKEWTTDLGRYRLARDCAEITLRKETSAMRHRLQTVWSSGRFQTGILMTKPGLYNDLVQYLSCNTERLPKKLRRFEQTALTYFCRMATKTSPFSTYTFTGVGVFEGDERLLDWVQPLRWGSSFSLNTSIAKQLNESLGSRFEVPLSLNETVLPGDGTFLFLNRKRDLQQPGIGDIHETVCTVDASEAVKLVFDVTTTASRPTTISTIIEAVHARLKGRATRERLRIFVEQLVECGFLTSSLEYEANHPHALRLLGAAVAECFNGLGSQLAATANEIENIVEELNSQAVPEQAKAIELAKEGVARLAGIVFPDSVDHYPKDTVRQDCHFTSVFHLSPAAFADIKDGLRLLTSVMPIFNTGYLLQRLVSNYFKDRYGKAGQIIPLTQFLTEFYSECYEDVMDSSEVAVWDPYLTHTKLDRVPEVAAMTRVRKDFVETLRKQIETESANSRAVNLSPKLFASYERDSGSFWTLPVPLGVGYLGQPFREHQEDVELSFALNQVVSGYGTYLARYSDVATFGASADLLFKRISEDLSMLTGDSELVEIIATFGLNFQIHVPLTSRRIYYPFEPRVTGNERIQWSDLGIKFNEVSDSAMLVNRLTGARVLPLKMGPLSPHLIPMSYKVLMSLGPLFVPDFSLLQLLEFAREKQTSAVYHYPRVRLGNLVLLRESWRVPSERGPQFPAKASELDTFLRIRRWARDLDLPARVFVVPMEVTDYVESARANGAINHEQPFNMRRLYKPFLVDFDSVVSCRTFQRLNKNVRAIMTISEMLPASQQSIFRYEDNLYATEMLLECYSSK